MSELGFKHLTVDNWREPDPLMGLFYRIDLSGTPASGMTGDDWARLILESAISEAAPDELRRVYEAGRGAMLYGYCFYPLFEMGLAHVTRSVETAVKLKCKEIGAPATLGFARAIDRLANDGAISWELRDRLHVLRELRNETTHLGDQNILPPTVALDLLRMITADINELFPDDRT